MIPIENVKCILVDLDDTLLACSPWVKPYFVWKTCAALYGLCPPSRTIRAMRAVKRKMKTKSSPILNHNYIIDVFAHESRLPKRICEKLYQTDLMEILRSCKSFFSPIPGAREFINALCTRYHFVLATNPLWPESFAKQRLSWAGLNAQSFMWITHSQNMRHCKPSQIYYDDILTQLLTLGLTKEACIFIGNDPKKDGQAIFSGITTVLLERNSRRSHWQLLKKENQKHAALFKANWPCIAEKFGVAS